MQLLPNSQECEQALLSSILQDISIARKVTVPELFYDPRNRILYDAINTSNSNDYSVLISTLSGYQIEEIGGKEYLSSLYGYGAIPEDWQHYYSILLDKYDKRRAIILADRIKSLAEECSTEYSDIEELAGGFRRTITVQDTSVNTGSKLASDLNIWMENAESNESGIEWGFQGLPKLIDRLRPSELCLIGGRPGSGKTSVANSVISLSCIPQKKSSLVFSLEMGLREETLRLLSILGRIPLQHLKNQSLMTNQDISRYSTSIVAINDSRLAIVDEILTIHQIYDKSRDYKENYGLDLVVIDHVQLVRYKDTDAMERREALDECGRIAKYMAKDLDCVVMLLTQISREDSSPFECSSLEAHADQYILVPQTESDSSTKELRVRKNRNGPVGYVECQWHGPCAAFY